MLTVALTLFAIAALGGLVMLYFHFKKNRNPPGALAVLHGVIAATALGILLWFVVTTGATGKVVLALGLFVLAALGGFFLVSYHVRNIRLPSAVVLIHAAVAVVAFLLLASVAMSF